MSVPAGNAEANAAHVHKRDWVQFHPASFEVISGRKFKSVVARLHGLAFQQRLVDPAVRIGGRFQQQLIGAVKKSNLHACRGAAMSGI